MAPMAAIASAPQKATRADSFRTGAPPILAPTAPSAAGNSKELPDIAQTLPVFRALTVDVWPNRLNRLLRRRVRHQGNQIDRGQGGQGFGPKPVVEKGAARTLFYKFSRGNGNHKHIASGFRLLEMKEVPWVNQVERSMAMDNSFTLSPQRRHPLRQLGKGDNLGECAHCKALRRRCPTIM